MFYSELQVAFNKRSGPDDERLQQLSVARLAELLQEPITEAIFAKTNSSIPTLTREHIREIVATDMPFLLRTLDTRLVDVQQGTLHYAAGPEITFNVWSIIKDTVAQSGPVTENKCREAVWNFTVDSFKSEYAEFSDWLVSYVDSRADLLVVMKDAFAVPRRRGLWRLFTWWK